MKTDLKETINFKRTIIESFSVVSITSGKLSFFLHFERIIQKSCLVILCTIQYCIDSKRSRSAWYGQTGNLKFKLNSMLNDQK